MLGEVRRCRAFGEVGMAGFARPPWWWRGSGFAGEYICRSYSCSFSKFVVLKFYRLAICACRTPLISRRVRMSEVIKVAK